MHEGDDVSAPVRTRPANVLVNISSPTVFGAKFVSLVPPPDPSPQSLSAGLNPRLPAPVPNPR